MVLRHVALGPCIRRTVALLACAATAFATAAPSVSAMTCRGDYCSGKDPLATGCAQDARTVAHNQLPAVSQRLELRWSPRCKTNWARLLYDADPSWIKVAQKSTNYTQWFSNRTSTSAWTRMIYSPGKCVIATVQTRQWGQFSTACV